MKTIPTRVLLFTLVALMMMTAVACGKDPNKDPGYILNQSNTEAPENEITAFYHGNEGTLDALASSLTRKGTYMAYSYTYRMTDYKNGTLEFYVQQQTKAGGAWEVCTDENANRLTKVKFTGTLTYDPAISKNIVIFIPRMAVTEKTLSLVYCTTEGDKDIVERGAYHKGCSVTLTQIEGNWYCAEAVRNTQ